MTRIHDLEKNAIRMVGGEVSMTIDDVTGGAEEDVGNMRLSDLSRETFTVVNGQVAVRVAAAGGTGDVQANRLVTNNTGSDIVRTQDGNVISIRFGD